MEAIKWNCQEDIPAIYPDWPDDLAVLPWSEYEQMQEDIRKLKAEIERLKNVSKHVRQPSRKNKAKVTIQPEHRNGS